MQTIEDPDQVQKDKDGEMTILLVDMVKWEKYHKWTSQRKWIIANELDVTNFNEEREF